MPKRKQVDNPPLPADYNNPTEEDKRKVYVWGDSEDIVIDSQVHIYNEIPNDEHHAIVEDICTWFYELDEYKHNQEHFEVFYTREQMFRFCRARQFKADKIKEMVLENVKWRLEQTPHLLRFADMESHAQTGKTHLREQRDHWGRPVLVIHNKYNNSKDFTVGAQLTFYTLEMSSRLMTNVERGPSHHCVFMNLEGFSYSSQPPMDIAKAVGYALTTGYPERMGHVIIYAAPWLFRAFYATIASLILDDRTKSKVIFIKEGDKHLESKLEFLLGPNWKELSGIDQPQSDESVAPGFYPETYAEHCYADDERRFGNRLTSEEAKKLIETKEHDREEAELEAVPPKVGPITEVESTTTTTTTTTGQVTIVKDDVPEQKPE